MSDRLFIIGAGPIGLEAALYARELGYAVTVLEKNDVAHHVRQWGHVRLFSPFAMNHSPLARRLLTEKGHDLPADAAYLTGNEYFQHYLAPLADLLGDNLVTGCEVTAISRKQTLKGDHIGSDARKKYPFRILTVSADEDDPESYWEQQFEAHLIIDASGTYGNPNDLGDGGIPALGEIAHEDHIAYHLEDIASSAKPKYLGKSTLLVGDGQSAATTVQAFEPLLKADPDTRLIWLTRRDNTAPITVVDNDPLPGRQQVGEDANRLAKHPRVQWLKNAAVAMVVSDESGRFEVTITAPEGDSTFHVDRIIANVGYGPDNHIYRELQIHECYASRGPMKMAAALLAESASADCLTQTGKGPAVLTNPEPDFYIIGIKSYGRNSNFLLRIGHEQVQDVFRLISGNMELDLYQDKVTHQ